MKIKLWLAATIAVAVFAGFVSVRQTQQAPSSLTDEQTLAGKLQGVDDTADIEAGTADLEPVDHEQDFRDGDVRLLVNRGNVRASERYFNCEHDGCDSELIIDNPYAGLSMDQLQTLAAADSTAAFQFAVKRYQAAETQVDIDVAVEYAMRSVALADGSDVSWMYNAVIEHLDLGLTTNPETSDEHLRSSYIWFKAGENLSLVEPEFVAAARKRLIDRGIAMDDLDDRAQIFALDLQGMRLRLTGQPTASTGEFL